MNTTTLEVLLERLLNKVNKVTAYHRHHQKVPDTYLDELCSRQIEVEEMLESYQKKKE